MRASVVPRSTQNRLPTTRLEPHEFSASRCSRLHPGRALETHPERLVFVRAQQIRRLHPKPPKKLAGEAGVLAPYLGSAGPRPCGGRLRGAPGTDPPAVGLDEPAAVRVAMRRASYGKSDPDRRMPCTRLLVPFP